jgi:DNA-binding HxlR family transcriptional regulator
MKPQRDKWSLWTISVIEELGQPMRFSRIMDQVEGISQKSLTKTLRGLERDGLITCEVFAEVPPRVEYTITALGSEMLDNIAPLWIWVTKRVQRFVTAVEPRSIVADSGPGRTTEVTAASA